MDISVVLITYNRPIDILKRAYNSVINQTYRPKEFIIVNAGTTAIPNLENCTIINAPNSNGCEARNIGSTNATAEYIAFLDDDDEWLPNHLESHFQLIDGSIGIVFSHNPSISKWDLIEENIMIRNWVGPTSFATINRNTFNKVGKFDATFESNQEWDLWIRISKCAKIVECPLETVIKHDSEISISSSIPKRINGWRSILKKYNIEYKSNKKDYCMVTKVFWDEMYNKRSIKGIVISTVWRLRAILQM